MAAFTHRIRVMFNHCDPAGIVFYPRYFEMTNEVVETFFDRAIGWPFARMHGTDRKGVPTVRIEARFQAASRLGEDLDWSLSVTRIGGASLDLAIAARADESARLDAAVTLVLVDLGGMRSVRWSDDHRTALALHMETPAA